MHPFQDVEAAFRFGRLSIITIHGLKRYKTSIERNPRTVNRICGRLYELCRDSLRQRHECRFKIDFVLLERPDFETVLHQQRRQVAVIVESLIFIERKPNMLFA